IRKPHSRAIKIKVFKRLLSVMFALGNNSRDVANHRTEVLADIPGGAVVGNCYLAGSKIFGSQKHGSNGAVSTGFCLVGCFERIENGGVKVLQAVNQTLVKAVGLTLLIEMGKIARSDH